MAGFVPAADFNLPYEQPIQPPSLLGALADVASGFIKAQPDGSSDTQADRFNKLWRQVNPGVSITDAEQGHLDRFASAFPGYTDFMNTQIEAAGNNQSTRIMDTWLGGSSGQYWLKFYNQQLGLTGEELNTALSARLMEEQEAAVAKIQLDATSNIIQSDQLNTERYGELTRQQYQVRNNSLQVAIGELSEGLLYNPDLSISLEEVGLTRIYPQLQGTEINVDNAPYVLNQILQLEKQYFRDLTQANLGERGANFNSANWDRLETQVFSGLENALTGLKDRMLNPNFIEDNEKDWWRGELRKAGIDMSLADALTAATGNNQQVTAALLNNQDLARSLERFFAPTRDGSGQQLGFEEDSPYMRARNEFSRLRAEELQEARASLFAFAKATTEGNFAVTSLEESKRNYNAAASISGALGAQALADDEAGGQSHLSVNDIDTLFGNTTQAAAALDAAVDIGMIDLGGDEVRFLTGDFMKDVGSLSERLEEYGISIRLDRNNKVEYNVQDRDALVARYLLDQEGLAVTVDRAWIAEAFRVVEALENSDPADVAATISVPGLTVAQAIDFVNKYQGVDEETALNNVLESFAGERGAQNLINTIEKKWTVYGKLGSVGGQVRTNVDSEMQWGYTQGAELATETSTVLAPVIEEVEDFVVGNLNKETSYPPQMEVHRPTGDGFDHGQVMTEEPKGLVIHHTGGRGDVNTVINTLKERGLSVQYVIDREGKLHQLMDENAVAWHAGKNNTSAYNNQTAIGVEIIANDDSDILPIQIEAVKELSDYLLKKYGWSIEDIVAHGEIATHKQPTEGATALSAIRGE